MTNLRKMVRRQLSVVSNISYLSHASIKIHSHYTLSDLLRYIQNTRRKSLTHKTFYFFPLMIFSSDESLSFLLSSVAPCAFSSSYWALSFLERTTKAMTIIIKANATTDPMMIGSKKFISCKVCFSIICN